MGHADDPRDSRLSLLGGQPAAGQGSFILRYGGRAGQSLFFHIGRDGGGRDL